MDFIDFIDSLKAGKSDIENSKDLRKQILNFASNFMGGIWNTAKSDDIKLQKLE